MPWLNPKMPGRLFAAPAKAIQGQTGMSKRIEDKRRHPRFHLAVRVEVHLGDGCVRIMRTRDMCESGVYLEADDAPLPPVGSTVRLRILDDLGGEDESPLVDGLVVREDGEGIGVQFDA